MFQTDDKGVFDTSLSEEYKHVMDAFSLDQNELQALALNSVDHIFETVEWKNSIRQYFVQWQTKS